jgi:hypothetical protein
MVLAREALSFRNELKNGNWRAAVILLMQPKPVSTLLTIGL